MPTRNETPPRGANGPTISVIIPCYNSMKWISQSICSILSQNYSNIEVIVVDDGSTDDSLSIVESFGSRITVLSGPNRGACHARNRGLSISSGEYILFLDGDDYIVGDYITQMANASAGVDVVVGAHAWIDTDKNILQEYRSYGDIGSPQQLLAKYLLHPVQGGAFLWRRGPLLATGAWDETLPISQDADLAIRMLLRLGSFRIAALQDAHAVWRAHSGPRITTTMSRTKIEAILNVLMKHAPALRALENDAIDEGLADRFYGLSRLAFALAHDRVGGQALRQARSLGLSGHPGSLGHRVASSVLGLRMKARLTASYYRWISSVPPSDRPYPYNLDSLQSEATARPAQNL